MNTKSIADITFEILSKKEKIKLLKDFKGTINLKLEGKYEFHVYTLNEGKFLYDLGEKALLFEDFKELDAYVSYCNSIAEKEIKTSIPSDFNFINKTDLYISLFINEYGDIEFSNILELKKIDKWCNEKNIIELEKFKLSLVAILGQFIIESVPNSNWVIFETDPSGFGYAITDSSKLLFCPSQIIDLIFKSNKKNKFNLFDSINRNLTLS